MGISIECPHCMIKYTRVPAANFETNFEIIQVLERVQATLQQQQMQIAHAPGPMMGYPIYPGLVTPQKATTIIPPSSPFKTPPR